MAEIYRDSVGLGVQFSVPGSNVLSAHIDRRGVITQTSHAVINGAPVVSVPYSVTRYDGKFDAVVKYEVEGREYEKRDTHEIVTPLFTPEELIDYDPDFERLVRDPKGERDYTEIKNLEVIIRSLFEVITGQKFGLEFDTVTFPGSGSRMVGLPKRAVEVHPYRSTNSISSYGWTQITNDGWVLKAAPRSSWVEKFEPDLYSVGGRGVFSEGRTYSLTGLWGYHSVPEDIVTAAKLLASDYGCDQSLWRDRWIKSIRAADWRVEFDSRAYILTGNVKVDQILDKYTLVRMVVL